MTIYSRSSVQNLDNWWFWTGKTNTLLNLIKEQDGIDKIYLYAKDLIEPKYELMIKKCKDAGIKHLNDLNAFIECSNTMDDVYENIDDCNPNRKRKFLIVFGDMIADIMSNKKFQAIKNCLEMQKACSLVFFTQSYFSVPKDIRLNSTHLIMKISNNKELHNIAINHLADIDYKDLVKIYRKCTREPYSFLTIDKTLSASDPLKFRKTFFSSYKDDSN